MSEKTEEPTARRLQKAFADGDAPISTALGQALAFVVALALAPALVASAVVLGTSLLQGALRDGVAASPWELALAVLAGTVPIVAAAAATAGVVAGVQAGGAFAVHKLAPDLSRLDVVSGLGKLLTRQRLWSVFRAVIAAAVVGALFARELARELPSLAASTGELGSAAFVAGTLIRRAAWRAALVGLGLALVDLLVVRQGWLARLRMTKDEVKREHKESEGDPELVAARKRAHQELLASAAVHAVRDATVLIVNPTHLCTALDWDEEQSDAPRVIAQGDGDLARRMIAAAEQWGVPVVRDVPLAHALKELAVGDEIPEALYEAVAEILRELLDRADA